MSEAYPPRLARLFWLLPVVVAPLALAVPFFFGKVFLFRDLLHYFVPQQELVTRALSEGRLPQWNPLLYGGAPFLAEPDVGLFYPLNRVFQILPAARAATLFVLLHLPLAAAGTLLLARTLGLSRIPATIASVAYVTSGYLLSMHTGHLYFASTAWLPLATALLVRLADAPSRRRAVAAAGGIAALVLNGDLQMLMLAVGLAGALVLGGRARLRGLVLLGVASMLGALVASIQLVPTLLFAPYTVRAHGLPLEQSAAWSLHPIRWVEFMLLHPFGISYPENGFWGASLIDSVHPLPWAASLYLGPIVTVLAIASLRGKGRVRALWFIIAIALFIAAGSHLPVFAVWHRLVPFANRFRFPEKFAALVTLALALLAGRAVEDRIRPLVAFVFTGSLLAVLALWAASIPAPLNEFVAHGLARASSLVTPERAVHELVVALVHSASLCLVAALALRFLPSRVPIFILALVFADGIFSGRGVLSFGDASFLSKPPPIAERVRAALSAESAGRFYRDRSCHFPGGGEGTQLEQQRRWEWRTGRANFPSLLGLADVVGYGVAESPDKIDAWQRVGRVNILRAARLFGAAVRLGCSPSGEPLATPIERPLRRAFFVEDEQGVDGRESLLSRLPFIDPDRIALIEDIVPAVPSVGAGNRVLPVLSEGPRQGLPALDATAHVERDLPEDIVIAARGPGGLLVLADSFAPGWSATIDDQNVAIYRVDLLFRGVRVPPGEHRVHFRYVTPGLRLGAWTTLLAGLFSLMLLVSSLRRAPKPI